MSSEMRGEGMKTMRYCLTEYEIVYWYLFVETIWRISLWIWNENVFFQLIPIRLETHGWHGSRNGKQYVQSQCPDHLLLPHLSPFSSTIDYILLMLLAVLAATYLYRVHIALLRGDTSLASTTQRSKVTGNWKDEVYCKTVIRNTSL